MPGSLAIGGYIFLCGGQAGLWLCLQFRLGCCADVRLNSEFTADDPEVDEADDDGCYDGEEDRDPGDVAVAFF